MLLTEPLFPIESFITEEASVGEMTHSGLVREAGPSRVTLRRTMLFKHLKILYIKVYFGYLNF